MKKFGLAVLRLLSASVWGGAEPKPADYAINIQVSSSR
jgi:hypothetical protein